MRFCNLIRPFLVTSHVLSAAKEGENGKASGSDSGDDDDEAEGDVSRGRREADARDRISKRRKGAHDAEDDEEGEEDEYDSEDEHKARAVSSSGCSFTTVIIQATD